MPTARGPHRVQFFFRNERRQGIAARVCALAAFVAIPALAGCERRAEIVWKASGSSQDLSAELQTEVQQQLVKYTGTPALPKLLGNDSLSEAHLKRGQAVYQQYCAACHGDAGDGAGPASQYLDPRPRDYRKGIFKFTSTPYGAKPRRQDLVRTIRRGAKGTSMPAFPLLSDDDLEAVVDYVLVLTHRGELEEILTLVAANDDELDPELVPDEVQNIVDQWATASQEVVLPETRMPPYGEESIEKGKQAFLTEEAGCFKCHGPDGRALVTANVEEFKDAWGRQTQAADLTSGMFHGGDRPVDIYRRIYSGINGTPMPEFKSKFADDPEMFWHLVHFVEYIAGARRREVMAQDAAERQTQDISDAEQQEVEADRQLEQ